MPKTSNIRWRDLINSASDSQVLKVQESCAIAKMTARSADKNKQTATPPPKIT